ncbi:heavy metal-binding domain-containing protein [Acaryochloris sp. IP29b_bin.148]|uniref:YbjQ family protein n=1 Tax=Acaryochloris sp. IP29b_bin.148 TaxID=2969218 RepID=UPI0026205FCF|nr:heavy metal-binding domain-containing protein [Acaryochloris sp. IP29b_bin.148]
MLELLVIFGLLALGYVAGSIIEQNHYASIKVRERRTQSVPVYNIGAKYPLPEAKGAKLFVGSVVISSDYYKAFLAQFSKLIGGQIFAYESLLDRGRREALLRMKEDAIRWGAKKVVNVRLETATIGNSHGDAGILSIEVIAYGTGLR